MKKYIIVQQPRQELLQVENNVFPFAAFYSLEEAKEIVEKKSQIWKDTIYTIIEVDLSSLTFSRY